jgi:hypothetical protein
MLKINYIIKLFVLFASVYVYLRHKDLVKLQDKILGKGTPAYTSQRRELIVQSSSKKNRVDKID